MMKWWKPSTWSGQAKAIVLTGMLGSAIILATAGFGTAHFRAAMARMSFTRISGTDVVTGIDNIIIGATTPVAVTATDITATGTSTSGAGADFSGWVVEDAMTEVTSTGAAGWGTLTYIDINNDGVTYTTSTYYVEAVVTAQGTTETQVSGAYKVAGGFKGDGTTDVQNLGTGTYLEAENASSTDLRCMFRVSSERIDLSYFGSSTADVKWGGQIRYSRMPYN